MQNRRKQLNELTYDIGDAEEECLFGTHGKHRKRCSSRKLYLKQTVQFLRGLKKSPKPRDAA